MPTTQTIQTTESVLHKPTLVVLLIYLNPGFRTPDALITAADFIEAFAKTKGLAAIKFDDIRNPVITKYAQWKKYVLWRGNAIKYL